MYQVLKPCEICGADVDYYDGDAYCPECLHIQDAILAERHGPEVKNV